MIIRIHPYANIWDIRVGTIYGKRQTSWYIAGTPVLVDGIYFLELSRKIKYFSPDTGETLVVTSETPVRVPIRETRLGTRNEKGSEQTEFASCEEKSECFGCVEMCFVIRIERSRLSSYDQPHGCDIITYSQIHNPLLRYLFPEAFPSCEQIRDLVNHQGSAEVSKFLFSFLVRMKPS